MKKFEYSIGNKKIGTDTIIFNMGSAERCPSKKLKLCQLPDPERFYARKAERLYPNVLPFRKRQAHYWKTTSPERISRDIRAALARHKKIKYIRVNEAGDFYKAQDVEKLCLVAAWIPSIIFYVYTARADLYRFFKPLQPRNLVINGFGFMADNNFSYEAKGTRYICPGDCRWCNWCKEPGSRIIKIGAH